MGVAPREGGDVTIRLPLDWFGTRFTAYHWDCLLSYIIIPFPITHCITVLLSCLVAHDPVSLIHSTLHVACLLSLT